jgi:tetratricopeptide (TPR) repeat protein
VTCKATCTASIELPKRETRSGSLRSAGWSFAGAVFAVLGLLSSFTREAAAGIDPWRVAREPQTAKLQAWAELLDRERVSADPYLQGAQAQQKLNQRCAVRLQLIGVERGDDERAAYLLAECLSQSPGQYQSAARDVWRQVLARWPSSPQAAHGWESLGMAELALDAANAAEAAFTHALQLEWLEEARARLFCARGQVRMERGELARAQADFWAAMNEAEHMETYALAQWGLGVAFDRQRDFPQAIAPAVAASRARFGSAGRTSVLDLEEIMLFPAEDEHYYRALGLMAEAASNKAGASYTSQLQSAQLMWLQYLDVAPETSFGVVRAKEHLQAIRRELHSDDDD